MNTTILTRVNKIIKKSRPVLDKNIVCDSFRNGTFLEIAFMSKRCKNDASGSCIMCDYGAVDGIKSSELYLKEMESILQKENEVQYLLLCTNGSIMDSNQIPEETFYKILEYTNKSIIPDIIIEAHYSDITNEKLRLIKKFLCSKNVTIELGMETTNQDYQDSLIMKHIDMKLFKKTVAVIQSYGFSVDVNILFGLPFLSEKEQLNDTRKSIFWAFEHNCNPVIFPVNIKPYTLLMNMYENGYYKPVSHWLLLLLLSAIEPKKLSSITISYYGNRDENYYGNENKTIFPDCCPVCKRPLLDFYEAFYKEEDAYQKKQLLNQILKFDKCDCLKKQKERLDSPDCCTFQERYTTYTKFLKKEYISIV